MSTPTLLKGFGRRLRELRKRQGLTQMVLAHRSGLHVTQISRLERGQREPRVTTLYRVARGLGREPGELLGEAARGVTVVKGEQIEELLEDMLSVGHQLDLRKGGNRGKLRELEGLILQALELLRQALPLVRGTEKEEVPHDKHSGARGP